MKIVAAFAVLLVSYASGSAIKSDEPIQPSYDAFADCRLLFQSRETRGNPVVLTLGDLNSVLQSSYRRDRPLRISTHGWNANANDGTHHTIARVWLDRGDFNFIFLDWSIGAGTANYLTARNNVPSTGAFVAAFLDWLHANDLLDYSQVTMIGFSLGAHVAGFTGKQTQRGKINTIVGLDPAGPLFPVNDPTQRLASGDAEYVEAIHTNGRANGIGAVIADVDFFPNGGLAQPGCTTGTGCSHSRAVQFWVESITSAVNNFRGNRCATEDAAIAGNCNLTPVGFLGGEPSNHRFGLRGIFHLVTNAEQPFARG